MLVQHTLRRVVVIGLMNSKNNSCYLTCVLRSPEGGKLRQGIGSLAPSLERALGRQLILLQSVMPQTHGLERTWVYNSFRGLSFIMNVANLKLVTRGFCLLK